MNTEKYAKHIFSIIFKKTFSSPGVMRKTYGEGENFAHHFIIKELKKFTKNIIVDYGGNFLATYQGKITQKTIVIGSHLDSQPHGGNFDGLDGVVMGLCLIKNIHESKLIPNYNIAVMGIRGEESCWFPYSYIGSKIALGIFDPKLLHTLKRSDTKKSLANHIDEAGFNSKFVKIKKIKFIPKNIHAFIEPHIEQGPILEKIKKPLGIVTGIRGSFRYRHARCIGQYLHSGATPLSYRQDSVVAVSMLVNNMHNYWKNQNLIKKDLTITFGEFNTDYNEQSFAKSSGLVNFCIDVRSESKNNLKQAKQKLFNEIKNISKLTNTKFILGKETDSESAIMNKELINRMIKSAKKNHIEYQILSSGAGHDASVFANYGIPSSMLFIRNKHGSHNPKEFMSIKQFLSVLKVLETTIINFN